MLEPEERREGDVGIRVRIIQYISVRIRVPTSITGGLTGPNIVSKNG